MQVTDIFGDKEFTLELGTMCTDCEISSESEVLGDPTEIAIVSKAIDMRNR